MKNVTLRLTPAMERGLRELVDTYLDANGPAMECMQDWEEPHADSDLSALREEVLRATAPEPEPRYQLNLTEAELGALTTLLDFHRDDDPGEDYDHAAYTTMADRVAARDLIDLQR